MRKLLSVLMIGVMSLNFAQTSGAYIAPGEWRVFLDYNLGADGVSDPLVPSQGLHGNKYKWGKATPLLTAFQDQSYPGYVTPWDWNLEGTGTWSDTNKGTNDPCPSEYRIPTETEWKGVMANNTHVWVGDYISGPGMATNFSSGLMIGTNLFLPAAGARYSGNGTLQERGMYGYYATSTEYVWAGQNPYVYFQSFIFSKGWQGYTQSREKNYAGSVRCIKEQLPPLFSENATLGTKDTKLSKKNTIYPNPAKNEFYVKGDGKVSIEIYDITGRLLDQNTVQSSREPISTKELKNGSYVLKITSNGKSSSEKLVINK